MNRKLSCLYTGVFAVSMLWGSVSADSEIKSTLTDQTSVAVTIYNENLALVKDSRTIALPSGEFKLAFSEVSAQIRPETTILRNRSDSGQITLLEQNFDYDLLTPEKLLDKYVGRTVTVIKTNPATGSESAEQALVLSANNGVILQFPDRIETGVSGRIVYSDVPNHLRDRPTLVMSLQNETEGEQNLELSYLTRGLSWQSDYVAELGSDETTMDLAGWMTLDNQSGARYENALLQLVAGDVQQVQQQLQRTFKSDVVMESMAAAPAMQEESLLDYHLYTLERPTTLADNQKKQVAFMSVSQVPVQKTYLLNGFGQLYGGQMAGLPQKEDIGVYLNYVNDEASGLGKPMPKGIVRVYKKDSQDRIQFVGEDRIDHTPKNSDLRLKLGNAFDVTANRIQSDFKKLPAEAQYRYVAEIEQIINISNARDVAAEVIIREPIPGDWEILNETNPHIKTSANSVEWLVTVPPDSEVEHRYRVKVRY